MTGRSMARLLVLIVSLVVALAGAGALRPGSVNGQHQASARPTLQGTDVFPAGLHRVPPFALRDQDGKLITPARLRGHVFAVTFLDSICRKACPVEGRELASVQRSLGSHTPLTVVVVSVDPVADKPATARAFMRESRMSGPWHWLFGSQSSLVPVWIGFGISVQPVKGDINHTAAVYLVDRHGWMRVADGVPFLPSQLVESVRALTT
jgi:cytochrome oxidase Cu insertion factor (SCO1/SenC/PrrC family)